jgi:hypothetical protein
VSGFQIFLNISMLKANVFCPENERRLSTHD